MKPDARLLTSVVLSAAVTGAAWLLQAQLSGPVIKVILFPGALAFFALMEGDLVHRSATADVLIVTVSAVTWAAVFLALICAFTVIGRRFVNK